MHIHIVAVSGTAMGSLAGLLRELGHEVSGSDVAFDPPMGPELEKWGVRCLQGFDAAHLEPKPDLVVIGNVCRADNVEARAAIDGGLDYTHIAGALARFVLADTSPLVVAGTHGKTTTTALSAYLLDRAGAAPGFLVGGLPHDFEHSFRAPAERRLPTPEGRGRRRPFVIEGDEYDTAFFEKTAKFLHYAPEVAIITSIEHDHVDIYPSLAEYLRAFERLVALVPEHGLIVANAADPLVRQVVASARAEVAYFALHGEDTGGLPAHWLAAPAETSASATSFDLFAGGMFVGRFALGLPGLHNLKNALAALAACAQGFGARLNQLAVALASFRGVRRRQDLLGTPRGVFVYDDFAHHPTAVRETLAALRSRHTQGELYAVFEPRSATACRKLHEATYPLAFDAADHVLFAPLGRKNLAAEEALDLDEVVRALRARGKDAARFAGLDAIIDELGQRTRAGDVVALLSNGAFGGLPARLITALAASAGSPAAK